MRRCAHEPASARTAKWLVWLGLCVVLATVPARATVLQDLGFDELVAQSAFIFVGKVLNLREEAQGELVYTLATFSVDETLKGSAPAAQIELRFVGGTAGGRQVQVEGQFIPPLGARGVFFVTSLDRKQVNPLTGWQQGWFPLMQDAAGLDFLDMRQRPDQKIPGLSVDPLVAKMQAMGLSNDAINAKVPRAFLFSLADFRAAIVDEMRRTAGAAQ